MGITYQFEYADEEAWRDWAHTIPRDVSLEQRITTLIEQDLRASERDGSAEGKTVDLLASRIRIRAQNVRAQVRDGELDPDEALGKLEKIIELTEALEG